MHRTLTPVALATAILLSAPAMAQQQGTAPGATAMPRLVEVEEDDRMVPELGMTVDQLDDMDLYGPGGEEIGEVDNVLADDSGAVVAVTAEVGGFLGIGDREVIVGLSQLQLAGDRLVTNMTRAELEQLPVWDD
jgi:PRC-barrel domain